MRTIRNELNGDGGQLWDGLCFCQREKHEQRDLSSESEEKGACADSRDMIRAMQGIRSSS